MDKKLVLIDGNSILYRSFYALPPLMTDIGEYTNALYGFANNIIKVINDIKPTHLCVAFDVARKTFRNDIYADYKATRKPMPDELRSQIPTVKEMLKLMNIKILEKEGIEADDILGTISSRFDIDTIIVTGDRDTLQLISPSTSIYFTKKGISDVKVMNEKTFDEEYGISPDAIVDLKAFQGDTADNIPGAKGVGPKTALELIQKYKTVDGVFKHLDELKPALKQKLEESKDLVYMSQKLATINKNVDIDCSLEELVYDYPFSHDVYRFMQKYSFNSIVKRKELFVVNEVNVKDKIEYIEKIDNKEKLQNAINLCEKSGVFAVFYDKNQNLYFGTKDKQFLINAIPDMFYMSSLDDFYALIKPLMLNEKLRKIFFDAKFAKHMMWKYGVEVKGKIEDLSILAHLVEGVAIKQDDDVLKAPLYDLNSPITSLFSAYENYLIKLKDLGHEKLYYDIELPLIDVLFSMEVEGFKVDRNRLDELGKQYQEEINVLVTQIYDQAGKQFNINSPKQLADILFDKLGLPHGRKKSTSVEVLNELANSHPIVPLILRYRKVAKLNSTYIEGLKPHIDKNDLVHTSFKQTLTTTGRLSSVEPNLQNIPVRTEESREVRSVYVAHSNNHVLIDADYSQIELRLLAHCSEDPFFIEAFNLGSDIHTQTACQVYGVLKENVTPEMRRVAKIVNFGIIYGISDFGLASDLKITPREARRFIDNFYIQHPKVREYMDNAVKTARDTGKISTILGRTRKMIDINSTNYLVRSRSERAAQNMPLQGSAADIVKLAMIKVYKALRDGGYKAKLIMQVHDELIVDCPLNEVDEVSQLVRECMNTAYDLKVPLVCDVTTSYRWSDGH